MYKLPKVKVPRLHGRKEKMFSPARPKFAGDEPESLSGQVQGMKASMIEERFAKALDEKRASYQFRYTLGAPRGLPGWFEVDFLVLQNGMIYPVEIDTHFTHRDKGRKDVLHDSRVLQELEKEGLSFFPKVTHIDGEISLADQKSAKALVKELFGGYSGIETPMPTGEAVYGTKTQQEDPEKDQLRFVDRKPLISTGNRTVGKKGIKPL